MNITTVLKELRPGAAWVLQGNELSGLQWLDTIQTRPTDLEITTAIAEYVAPVSLETRVAALEQKVN